MPGPLAGLKILEIAGIGPGPFCAMMLADMGAEVVRVDRAQNVSGGDPASPPADVLNRGRRSIGVDLKHPDGVETVLTLLEKAENRKVKVVLPVDVVVVTSLDAESGEIVSVASVPAGHMALDIGPKTLELMGAELRRAKTVLWNGPMGLFETKAFANGTLEVARMLAKVSGFTVVGGGDSAAAVKLAGPEVVAGIDHISTGGGASLELIEGKKLPGVLALESASA